MAREALDVRFGVVTAWPEEDWHSRRLVAACRRRGATAALDPADLSAVMGQGAVELRAGAGRCDFDAFVLARGLGRRGDADVQFEIYRIMEAAAVVANRIDALLSAQDKLRTSWLLRREGVPTPPAAAVQRPEAALEVLDAFGEVVLKPIAGSLGDGVARASRGLAGRKVVLEALERAGAVYLQRYVPHAGRDARLFVVGHRVAGAMERVAARGEWRTNVGLGASVLPLRPSPADRRAAVTAARALGLDWAGVDLVHGPGGPAVLEVNGNPSWLGLLDATGEDMAEAIAEHVWARARRRRAARVGTPEQARANHG